MNPSKYIIKRLFIISIVLVIILFSFNPGVFERKFFFNELISLFGFMVFFFSGLFSSFRFNKIDKIFYFMLFYIVMWNAVSIFTGDNLYFFARHSVITYSMFAYFLAPYVYKHKGVFYKVLRIGFVVGIINLFLGGPMGIFRTNLGIFMSSFLNQPNSFLFFIFISAFFPIILITQSETTLLFSLVLIVIHYFHRRLIKYLLIFTIFSIIVVLLIIDPMMTEIYKMHYKDAMALLYNDMSFFRSTFLPDNILPRLTMWHQVVVELFPKNIFGVGTGTMLWPYPNIIQPKMNAVGGELAHLYFIGAHNSFITLFGRFGVLYLIAHLMIYTVIFKNYFDNIRKIKLNNDTILFFIFISSTIIAFLNVSFESPIHASFYWLSLGLVSCSYRNLRAQSENNFFI